MKRLHNQEESRLRRAARAIFRMLMLGLGLAAIAYGVHFLHYSPAAVRHFALEQVEYRGLAHLEPGKLDSLMAGERAGNLLRLDLERIRRLVETEAWVKEARVRRKPPHRLIIQVQERQPVAVAAIDSELYLVDAEGVVLDPYGPRHHRIDRPIVKGLKNVARENAQQNNARRMQLYLQVVRALDAPDQNYNQSISEIDVENPERVAVIPDNDPVHIYLGKDDFLTRYRTFLSQKDLYERLKKQYGLIESVDVTYDNKIIFHTPQEKRGAAAPRVGEQS